MAPNLRELVKREHQLLQKLDAVERFINNFNIEDDECQIDVRLEVLDLVHSEFFVVRGKIELLLEDDAGKSEGEAKVEAAQKREEENQEIVDEFEDRVCSLKGKLRKLRPKADVLPVPATVHHSGEQPCASFSKVKLPEIRLPTFSGKVREWVTFRDTFRSLIHENKQLTAMDRFSYLRSSLAGEALQEVNNIELTAANYDVAWKTLETRYENKKLIVKAHLDAIFSLEQLKREAYDGLNHLIGEFEKNLQMLDKIGEKTADWSTILAHILCSRLDSTTLRHWETHHNSKEVPTYQNLLTYLRNHCSVLQSVAPSKVSNIEQRQPRISNAEQRQPRFSVCHTTVKLPTRCPFCNGSWHSAFQCGKFQQMTIPERNEAVMRSRLCRNCLQPGHYSRTCEKGVCHHCQQRHHSMLHTGQVRSSVPPPQSRPQTPTPAPRQPQSQPRRQTQQTHTQSDNAPTNTTNSHRMNTQPPTEHATTSQNYLVLPNSPNHNILLSTALIRIKDRFGNTLIARALLDSCSQHCLMTKEFANRLQFRESPTYLSIQGIGSSRSVSTRLVYADVTPRLQQISPFVEEMRFYVLPKLTISLPSTSVSPSQWKLPESASLADPRFFESGPVDVIVGAEFYMDLLTEGQMKITADGPTLQNTVFGWIVSGRVPSSPVSQPQSSTYVCSTADIQDQLSKFWELETCRTSSTHSVEESACEELFKHTTVRDEKGRFVVELPKKAHTINRLGESKVTAKRRFLGIEKRFAVNPELKALYTAFMDEYRTLGHMRAVTEEKDDGPSYYLPHHAVMKPDSTTTKLRVVFDASCRTSTGVSLNDGLMVGPTVQDELLEIVLHFRLHQYAIVADIAKMYRMVLVQPADQRLQRILWRDTPDQPIQTFELTTVTYGTASAPYLATKCLQKLADEGEQTHPIAAKVVKKSFYVDDMLAGVDDIEEGVGLVSEMVELMESAGFSLRKWNSNCREILLNVPQHLRDDRCILELDNSSSTVKTLGLAWEPSTDSFRFNSPSFDTAVVITKRVVLSYVSRLFDPLGLVGPVIVQAKMFIQELWKLESGWDDPLNTDLQEQWQEYRRNLAGLEGLTVARWIQYSSKVPKIELHGFCDASEKAYGACIYLRTIHDNGSVSVRLLISKSRVAPLENLKKKKKRQTIPRLELSSALLLAHVFEKVVKSIGNIARSFFYTDSKIVECWLASQPSRWKEFVANRTSEIQHITKDGVWCHVAGVENPADIISRGMTPALLQYQSLWWHGPHWLLLDEEHWPRKQPVQEDIDPSTLEERNTVTAVLQVVKPSEVFSLRSSLSDLLRLIAYIRRFCFNAREVNRNNRRQDYLTTKELNDAVLALVRLSQAESFPRERVELANGREVHRSSRIASLHPGMSDGIIRVGGRLQHADLPDSRKHPYILDHRHPLAKTIMVYYHRKLFHAGQQLLVSAVREKFWPTNARDLARKVIHECVPCFRAAPKVHEQLMADLPPERVTQCFPFQRTGVDYCGPFWITYPQRKCRPIKCFVAVFVCLVTKAVHLELVADQSTPSFLAALKRFCSRRGKPTIIMCDNAGNFIGAKRELDELKRLFSNQQFQAEVVREAAENSIEFRFIPARSPNFGGLWETAVKSFKTLFKRTIGTHTLEYDEMRTVLGQIEAILNSRPLTPVSNDPDDFQALTPGHFLIQRPLTAIPEPDLDDIPENRLSVWQKGQQYTQRLWKKWSQQYLSVLQNRTKWTRQRDNVRIGTMVVLKDENLPPLKWLLGRVTEIHPGSDGNIRVVTVRTKDGTYKRAISKICILPIRDNFEQQ